MSELINANVRCAAIRWKLLTGVSSLVLATYVTSVDIAKAENADHPLFWIDLSGQLAWNKDDQEGFLPPFLLTIPRPSFEVVAPGSVERQAPTSWDWDAKVSFQPEDSKWLLSVGIRYGKRSRHDYQGQFATQSYASRPWAFQNITADNSEKHTILDFKVGRDFGLGMNVSSTLSLGVRFAQFTSRANVAIESRPQNFNYAAGTYTRFNAAFDAKRSFSGVGPSLSWDGTAVIVGETTDSHIDVDWGMNASLLFGRQTVRGQHKTTTVVYPSFYPSPAIHNSVSVNRRKAITVPNLGGFAGLSWRLSNAKVAFGYRADFFFGAMDAGVDIAHRETVGFHGPFATISVGLGG